MQFKRLSDWSNKDRDLHHHKENHSSLCSTQKHRTKNQHQKQERNQKNQSSVDQALEYLSQRLIQSKLSISSKKKNKPRNSFQLEKLKMLLLKRKKWKLQKSIRKMMMKLKTLHRLKLKRCLMLRRDNKLLLKKHKVLTHLEQNKALTEIFILIRV